MFLDVLRKVFCRLLGLMLVFFLSISNSKVKADFSPSDAEGGILRHIKASSVGSSSQ